MEHVGGYTAFSSDLTAFVHAGDNELTVQARDDREASQLSRGKQSSRRGGIWYTPQSGIWQTVWYEWVPENYVKGNPLYAGPHYQSASLSDSGARARRRNRPALAAWAAGRGKRGR